MPEFWNIEGYDGIEKMFEIEVPKTLISDKDIEHILQLLCSRYLSEKEIIAYFINKEDSGIDITKNNLLDIRREEDMVTCGENPHFIARIITKYVK